MYPGWDRDVDIVVYDDLYSAINLNRDTDIVSRKIGLVL